LLINFKISESEGGHEKKAKKKGFFARRREKKEQKKKDKLSAAQIEVRSCSSNLHLMSCARNHFIPPSNEDILISSLFILTDSNTQTNNSKMQSNSRVPRTHRYRARRRRSEASCCRCFISNAKRRRRPSWMLEATSTT